VDLPAGRLAGGHCRRASRWQARSEEAAAKPVRVQRRASATGVIVVCGQKIALGRACAGQTISIAVD
jgi:hypothetical protein